MTRLHLVAGLMAYGTQPNLIFAIPSGAERLAAPRATATIIPHHPTIAQQIPPRASVAAAPDHFFWARVDNGRQICSLYFGIDHAKRVCPKAKSADATSEPPSGGSVWEHFAAPSHPPISIFLPDFDETPTPRHFAPLPNTAPFQSDHQLALAAVASPHCPKLRTTVAQSVAQLQHGLPTIFFPLTSLNLPAVTSQNYLMMLKSLL
ncbi:hypothetical protein L0F63_007134 [Massospora cicadina]|nr:hypothetical protein L0F63_007134 [Massospora cicadina]